MVLIKTFNEINDDDINLVGGKALSLGKLTRAKLPVPPGFVITTNAYKNQQNYHINDELEKAIFNMFDDLGAALVAVRSSATAEDAPDASWAGQFESFLNVRREDLLYAIKNCWQSIDKEEVSSYSEYQQIKVSNLDIAVIVQKMVPSEISGVAFSVSPITKNSNEIMIEAIYGLGELLVQGIVTPDNYVVDKSSLKILERHIATKNKMLTYSGSANLEKTVSKDKQELSSLDNSQLSELTKLIIEVEKYYHSPQDIEWAYENNIFYIVQSRPITTL